MTKKIPQSDTRILVKLISNDLAIQEQDLGLAADDINALRDQLIMAINKLIDTNFNQLLNALYRMDVSEEKVKYALASELPENVSPAIADLVIQRELQKIETRKRYRSSGISGDN